MTVLEGRTWLEILSEQESWNLLGSGPVGRIGVIVNSAPEIFPINFVVDDRTIVFRTDQGSKLHAIAHGSACCFEIDGIDVHERTGWSVMVKGRAEELVRPDDIRAARALPLVFWAVGDKSHWIRIRPTEVTGRRIHRRNEQGGRADG